MVGTIFALSSGQPPAGIGVIRISGPEAATALMALAGTLPPPREARLRTLCAPGDGVRLDQALVLWIPGPRSVTGEDMVELHCHGGRAVVAAVQNALAGVAGLRPAEAGEFTRRAFHNGRIDLNEAEGLADLLQAETEAQRRSAMAMADGHFSRKIERWQETILSLAAQVEAALDFSDEDDVPADGMEGQIGTAIGALAGELRQELARPLAERLRDGIRVVIAGPPNAGKSTLLNALAGRDAAIVSEMAGTTRDRIDVPVALEGIPFLITDTAGLRDRGADRIEAIGMDLARSAIEQADVLLWLGERQAAPRIGALCVGTKSDVRESRDADISLSALTGAGMDSLVKLLVDRARGLIPAAGEYALQQRQRDAVSHVADALGRAAMERDLLIVAEELRIALNGLDRLTGRANTEAMLDRLFGAFCIGK